MGLVAVDVRRPRARHIPDNALRPAARHRRERGLSGMRHSRRRMGRHARQQARQVDRLGARAANRLSVAIPPTMRAIAMTDRGLRSPNLWEKIRSLGWRPYMRRRMDTVFRIDGGKRMPARWPVSAPGRSFIGRGTAFSASSKRLSREYNRHPGRVSGRAVDHPDRPPAGGGGSVVARDALLDRNWIQGAEKRGLAAAENPANQPRAGGAPLARAC